VLDVVPQCVLEELALLDAGRPGTHLTRIVTSPVELISISSSLRWAMLLLAYRTWRLTAWIIPFFRDVLLDLVPRASQATTATW